MSEANRGPGETVGGPARKPRSRLVIAIDGPVGAGKSTMARELARALGVVHIDSGAMYRAMGWKAMEAGLDLADHGAMAAAAHPRHQCLAIDAGDWHPTRTLRISWVRLITRSQ